MKKSVFLIASLLIVANSFSVSASQEEISNYFSDFENVTVWESGNEEHKSLFICKYFTNDEIIYTDDMLSIGEEMGRRIVQATYEEWFNYEYVFVDIWSENTSRISTITIDPNNLEGGLIQSKNWNDEIDDRLTKKMVETELSPDTEETEETLDNFEYKNMIVEYSHHEIIENDVGEIVLVIYYNFTNNSNENKTFYYSFDDTCFQNGVELEKSWWYANEESHNSEKEIKPGTTITVASSFILGESRDIAELEISPWFSDKMLLEKKLVLE